MSLWLFFPRTNLQFIPPSLSSQDLSTMTISISTWTIPLNTGKRKALQSPILEPPILLPGLNVMEIMGAKRFAGKHRGKWVHYATRCNHHFFGMMQNTTKRRKRTKKSCPYKAKMKKAKTQSYFSTFTIANSHKGRRNVVVRESGNNVPRRISRHLPVLINEFGNVTQTTMQNVLQMYR